MGKKLVALLLVLSCFGLSVITACDDNNSSTSQSFVESSIKESSEEISSEEVHTHSFEVNQDYYYHWTECDCGETTEKITHSYVDGVCACGAVQKEPSEGLAYTLSADETYYSVTGIGTCTATDIVIPSTYHNLPVTSIGHYAFAYCDNLTSITIPDSVTSIQDYAFQYCYSLTNVTIPNSMTSIGQWTFSLSGLTSVTIPDSVISIGYEAFSHCSLKSITIPDSVTSIGDSAFYGCNGLKEITIPDSVTSIGRDTFAFCENLTSVTIGNGATYIGVAAFAQCKNLTNVTIGNSVTSIGNSAFSGCNNLTSATFQNTSGWTVSDTAISSSDLVNTSTAATYLKDTYAAYRWTCSNE